MSAVERVPDWVGVWCAADGCEDRNFTQESWEHVHFRGAEAFHVECCEGCDEYETDDCGEDWWDD